MSTKMEEWATVLALSGMFGGLAMPDPPARMNRDPETVADMKAAAEAKRQRKNAKRIASRAVEGPGNG